VSDAVLESVNVARVAPAPWAVLGRSAIDKRPVAGRVAVRSLGVDADEQAEWPAHGGPDKAVYCYAREDARWWAGELDRPMPPGCFGENLSTAGLEVTGAEIGERWRIGTVLLEVAQPRIPCRTLAGFWQLPDLVKRFTAVGRPGAYLRVIQEGDLAAGDPIEVVERPGHGVTIGVAFRAKSGQRELVRFLLDAPELPADWHEWARKVLAVL
jgi:MOSC domain-containing protein YiiM